MKYDAIKLASIIFVTLMKDTLHEIKVELQIYQSRIFVGLTFCVFHLCMSYGLEFLTLYHLDIDTEEITVVYLTGKDIFYCFLFYLFLG